MKFLVLLGVLAMQYSSTKSWTGDNYSEETFCILGWIGYLKRLSVIVIMLSGVVLYYVPESRPHARRACYVMIDFAANGLKAVLSPNESECTYEKIKSKYHRARYEQSLATQKQYSRETDADNGDFDCAQKSDQINPCIHDVGFLRERGKKKLRSKETREAKRDRGNRESRDRIRDAIIKDTEEPCTAVVQPTHFSTDKFEKLQKYLKTRVRGVKQHDGGIADNYAFLISGSPRQMAMIDQRCEKDDVVILQDFHRAEREERGTSTDRMSSKPEDGSYTEERPTVDDNNYSTYSRLEVRAQNEVPSDSKLEGGRTRNLECEAGYRENQYGYGDESGGNVFSESSVDINRNNEIVNSIHPVKSLQNSGNVTYERNSHAYSYDQAESNPVMKSRKLSNERKVNFRQEAQKQRVRTATAQILDQVARSYENIPKNVRKIKPRKGSALAGTCCNHNSYFTDRGGEADDENSQHGGRVTAKHNLDILDDRPPRESYLFPKNSDDSLGFDYDYDYGASGSSRMSLNRVKPALLRAVNWIFGGCPEASRRGKVKCCEVGKEEIREVTDEWLL